VSGHGREVKRRTRRKRQHAVCTGKKKNKKPQARRTWMAAALIGPVPGWHPGAQAKEAGEEKG